MASVSNTVQLIAEKVQSGPNWSSEQLASINMLVERLRLTDAISHQEPGQIAGEDLVASSNKMFEGPSSSHLDNKLQGAIDRLSRLVNERPQTVPSIEAESIIEDLKCLVVDLLHVENDQQIAGSGRKRKAPDGDKDDFHEKKEYEEHIRRVTRALSGSDRVVLNKEGS